MKKIIAAALALFTLLTLCSCKGEERSVRTVEINDAGELIIIFSDGTQSNAGLVKGDKGDAGERGADGKDGVDGINGAEGKDGKDGKDGAAGERGPAGADGRGGRSIESVSADGKGNLLVAYDDGKTETVELLGSVYLFGGSLNDEGTARWALYNGGFLRIFGEGTTYDYGEDNTPWAVVASMISAVFIEPSENLTLDAELLSGFDPEIVFYVEETTPMWVDMTVSAPIYKTAAETEDEENSTPTAYLPLGTELAVLELNDSFAKILYNGEYAYIAKKYVRDNNGSVVYQSVELKLTVTGSYGAALRYFPDATVDNKYVTLGQGAALTCTGVSMNGNWYRVSYEGETLYVYYTVVSPAAS